MPGPVNRRERATLPGASELFRTTEPLAREKPAKPPRRAARSPEAGAPPSASGRVKHDHKITVYFSEDELNALEDINLELRRVHGIRVDRGHIVRVAVSRAIADLAAHGPDSFLVSELKRQ